MKNKKAFFFLMAISILSFIGLLLVYPKLPETIPIHFGPDGQADGFGSRNTALLLGLIPAGLCLLLWFLPKMDPRRKNYEKHEKAYVIMAALVVLFLIFFNWITVLIPLGFSFRIEIITPCLVGLLFIVMGNFMPQIRPNYFMGIRTPWALENEYVWKKTHRFGGIVFWIMGAFLFFTPFLSEDLPVMIIVPVILGGCVLMYGYSYFIYRKYMKNGPDGQ